MIVQPTPTAPRSPLGRGLRAAGLVLPVVLLAVVVAAALLGPREEGTTAPDGPRGSAAGLVAGPSPTGPSAAPPSQDPLPPPDPLEGVPPAFGGVRTASPADVLARRRSGEDPGVVAVAGYLALDRRTLPVEGSESRRLPSAGCAREPDLDDPADPWCVRAIVLAEGPWRLEREGGTGFAGIPAHLHGVAPAGVRLPAAVAATGDGGPAVPVLVVGRFERPACEGDPRCDDGFVIDRVAWADGTRFGIAPLLDPLLDTGAARPNPFAMALDERQLPLLAVLAWPEAISRLDPAAARAAAMGPPGDPVWYVRMLEREGRGPPSRGTWPRVRWMLLDEPLLRPIEEGDPAGLVASGILRGELRP